MECAIYHRPRILPKCDRGLIVFTIFTFFFANSGFVALCGMSKARTKILKLNAQGPPPIHVWLDNVTRMLEEEAPEGLYQEGSAGPQFMGDLFDDAPADPQGEECVSYVNALKCCKAFSAAKDLIGAEFSSVDEWFINWARYVGSPHALSDAEAEKQELMDRRLQYAIAVQSSNEKKQKPKVYTLSPRSFVTYTNAFMHIYCRRFPSSGFYVHNEYMMPRYWTMMKDAMRRYRLWYLQQKKAPKEPPVTNEELIKLCRSTDWNSPGARQLMRRIITLSQSGLRCVTACILTKETIGSEQNLRSGQCEMNFPEIKQRMPSLANSDVPFFNQLLVAGPDKRLCIIAALSNQLDDLRAAPPGVPYNWMFREVGDDSQLLESAANAGNVLKGSRTVCVDNGAWATGCNLPRSKQCCRVYSRSCQVYWRE